MRLSVHTDIYLSNTFCYQCAYFKHITEERKVKDFQETGDRELVDQQETDGTDDEQLDSEHEEYYE